MTQSLPRTDADQTRLGAGQRIVFQTGSDLQVAAAIASWFSHLVEFSLKESPNMITIMKALDNASHSTAGLKPVIDSLRAHKSIVAHEVEIETVGSSASFSITAQPMRTQTSAFDGYRFIIEDVRATSYPVTEHSIKRFSGNLDCELRKVREGFSAHCIVMAVLHDAPDAAYSEVSRQIDAYLGGNTLIHPSGRLTIIAIINHSHPELAVDIASNLARHLSSLNSNERFTIGAADTYLQSTDGATLIAQAKSALLSADASVNSVAIYAPRQIKLASFNAIESRCLTAMKIEKTIAQPNAIIDRNAEKISWLDPDYGLVEGSIASALMTPKVNSMSVHEGTSYREPHPVNNMKALLRVVGYAPLSK